MNRKSFIFIICLISFICITIFASENKPIFVSVLFRHGDRTPINPLKKNNHDWGIPYGELTPLGMQEEYELGELLRNLYVKKYGILPSEYNALKMHVSADGMNRTLMSAECVLYGLYPIGTGPKLGNDFALPFGYQPIPIYEDPILSHFNIPDEEMKSLQDEYTYKSKVWIDKQNSLKKYFQLWSEVSGESISSLEKAKNFVEYMHIEMIHHIKLPEKVDTNKQKEIFSELSSWIHAQQSKYQGIGILGSKKLLSRIIYNFNNFKDLKSTECFYLYSAHDTNILNVMSALGIPLDKNPRYSSYLSFEIYNTTYGNGIKLVYNGSDVKLPLKLENDGLYSFSSFATYVEKL